MNYQAVILDPKSIDIPGAKIQGQALNKGMVCLKFSLLNASGALDYEETQQVMTDEFGLVNINIGAGTSAQIQANNSTSTYSNFERIVWNEQVKSLQVRVSYDGCKNFVQVSSQILQYTPYALYAEAVDYKNVRDSPTKLSQFDNDSGFLNSKDLDPLKADIKSTKSDILRHAVELKTLDTVSRANSVQIGLANQRLLENKKASEEAFLLVNQSISSLGMQVIFQTNSIESMNEKIHEQESLIAETRNQLNTNNASLNRQIIGLQGQIDWTNSSMKSLASDAEMMVNKSIDIHLGKGSPSDQLYPSQKATKTYVDLAIYNAVGTGVADATTLAPGKVQLAGDLAGTAQAPTVPGLSGKENVANKSTSTSLGISDELYPSQRAVKLYVDQATQGIALQTSLEAKADKNSPTFSGTVHGITKSMVGLANVDNTSDASKPISLANQKALDEKASLDSPTFLGTPSLPSGTTATTQNASDNSTKIATTAFVATSIRALSGNLGVPYSGATQSVDLGPYELKANGIVIGIGGGDTTNTSVGNLSMRANAGVRNTAMGYSSLKSNLAGTDNTAFGYNALKTNTSRTNPTYIGSYNTAVGSYSLQANTTGVRNTSNGAFSLQNNVTGNDNSAFGYSSLKSVTTGYRNTALGSNSLYFDETGNENTAIGWFSLQQNSLGNYNSAIGNNSLSRNTTGSDNTAVGNKAGATNTTGSQNTFLGDAADVSSNNLTNATAIGYNAKVNASNTIVLGNSFVTKIGGQVGWTSASDRRIKKNIRNSHYGLSAVMRLRPVEYRLKVNELSQIGFIAQDVKRIIPEVITGIEGDLDKGEILGITYANLVPVLAKAIQEQQRQIEDQNRKLEEQTRKITYLLKLLGDKK